MNRALLPVSLASLLFTCGCQWSSATPADDAGATYTISEDASDDVLSPPDDANIPLLVDASSMDAGTATVVAAGGQETCSVTSAGTTWCWGSNVDGQLGTATGKPVTLPGSTEAIAAAFVPVQTTSAGSRAVAVAVGDYHACALSLTAADAGSEVQCWGENDHFQLGAALPAASTPPITVTGIGTDVTAIAAGGLHTCALAGGSVWCWGDDSDGQLGNDATTDSYEPVRVSALGSDVSAITAGGAHTCALTSAGAVWCWGFNTYGQLGNGGTTNSGSPVQVTGLGSGVTAIAAGTSHTCALTSAGAVMCWGWGYYGQLGNNSAATSAVPVPVSGLGASLAIAAGGTHSCAVAETGGAVSCWGDDQSGQLGDNDPAEQDKLTPVSVVGLAGATAIVAGTAHTCALVSGGGVQCWGWNVAGQLGNDTGADSQTAVGVCGF